MTLRLSLFSRSLALLAAAAFAMGCDKAPETKSGGAEAPAGKVVAKAAPEKAKAPVYPAGMEGAKKLLSAFVAKGADFEALTKALKPSEKDYEAFFTGKAVATAKAFYAKEWASGRAMIGHKPDQTELKVWKATVEQLTNTPKGNVLKSDAKHFPGGYSKVTADLKPGLEIYRFKFVKPGRSLGMGYDGLVHVNGRWVVFGKPWRALGREGKKQMDKMFDSMSPHDMKKMMDDMKKTAPKKK